MRTTSPTPFDLTAACRLAKQDPSRIPELAAAARAASRATPPRLRLPAVACFPGHHAENPTPETEPPALVPPPPMATLVCPLVSDDLRAEVVRAAGLVLTARNPRFEGSVGAADALRRLAAWSDPEDDLDATPARLCLLPGVEKVLEGYAANAPERFGTLARRLVALLHLDRHGKRAADVPLAPETAAAALSVAEWHRRVTAPPPVPTAPEPATLDVAALHRPAPGERPASAPTPGPAANTPDADAATTDPSPDAPTPADPDARRLADLLAAHPGQPLTARDAGRRLKLSAARVRELIAGNPTMFRAAEAGTKPSGGRPAQHLALANVSPAAP